jgi:hypothetical protein
MFSAIESPAIGSTSMKSCALPTRNSTLVTPASAALAFAASIDGACRSMPWIVEFG